jgi:hypothetical protein
MHPSYMRESATKVTIRIAAVQASAFFRLLVKRVVSSSTRPV